MLRRTVSPGRLLCDFKRRVDVGSRGVQANICRQATLIQHARRLTAVDVVFVSRVGDIDDDDRPCQSTTSANKASENASDPPTALLCLGVDFLRTARVGNLVMISRQNFPRSTPWRSKNQDQERGWKKGSLGSVQEATALTPKKGRDVVSTTTSPFRGAFCHFETPWEFQFSVICCKSRYACVKPKRRASSTADMR